MTIGNTVTRFHDRESVSAAFLDIRQLEDGLAIGFGVETNGDLDLWSLTMMLDRLPLRY